MKNLLVAIIVSLSFSIQAQSTLDGLWDTGEANTKINVSKKNSLWSGVVKASDIKDDIGELILKDLKKDGGKWTGKIYAPKRKEWYDVEIIAQENNLKLKVSAGIFSKSLEWKKS
jgi:uncharacterized protein (DUF2147 family)